jgi:putative serine/threonine protein kinase
MLWKKNFSQETIFLKYNNYSHLLMQYTKINKIAKGWSSYIWLVKIINGKNKGKIFVLKEVREKSNRKNLCEREGNMLALANTVNVGPKLIQKNEKENNVVMEFINGIKFLDFVQSKEFENITKKELYEFIRELYFQCMLLDSIGLTHTQLQVGKNILVKKINTKGKTKFVPIIIDFEKSSIRTDHKAKNIGQIESFLFYNPNGFVAKKIREKLDLVLINN